MISEYQVYQGHNCVNIEDVKSDLKANNGNNDTSTWDARNVCAKMMSVSADKRKVQIAFNSIQENMVQLATKNSSFRCLQKITTFHFN